jgi:hypothetical protein
MPNATPIGAAATPPQDALFALELEIARKADELVRRREGRDSLNLQCWLMAEAEVFGGESVDALVSGAEMGAPSRSE